jgi:hypothetical protein
LSRGIEAGEVAACGDGGHRDRALSPAPRLERVDDRGEPPGRPLVGAGLFQPRQPCGVVGDRSAVGLAHDLLCRGGTDYCAEPPEVGGTPGGPARLTEIVPQEQGFALALGSLESAESLCARPAQSPHRCILTLGHGDRGAVPRAHQAGQCERIPAVGFDPLSGLCGEQGGCHHPADMPCLGQSAGEPVPTGARFINQDALLAVRRPLTHKLIDGTLACTDGAKGDDLGVVFLGNVRHGPRRFMDLQAEGKRARLVHG